MGFKRGKRASSPEDVEPAASEDRSKRAKTTGDTAKAHPNAEISSALDKAPKTDSNGDPYWEISRQRRVTISTFKGRVLVNVREYYEKDGQELPGKKGISMTLEQFNSLVTLLPEISAVVEQKGGKVIRPDFSEASATVEDDEEMSDAEEEEKSKSTSKTKKSSPTKNFEATSDEDDE
ncbi:hypothetical protein MGYG_08902 [Nannizzia gypsea CBS 118893]|uniref:Transcriptional coactivator p15 (PC4) C-terminal domain-containing protein n=1 Tax=Arthroderma gypseum (strain ATCC MYA-4604 / CBS 118893) TaxID=535722 RepID=E5R202_ARTGP|nr:hypothetical protein MGYG_08902 [Nannizzia gypsea CBS 118893]EFQ97781.1 hypothetical protein MGYG_08902 [Nannizzia gypsea CBS 118893]